MGKQALTPKELLAELQEATRRYPPERSRPQSPHLDRLLEFEESLGRDRAKIEQDMERWYEENRDWGEELFREVIKNLPEEGKDLFDDSNFFAVGTLDKVEVNAQAIKAGNGGWLILLNIGLFTFLYKVARALATRFVAVDKNGERPYGDASIAFEETCRLVAEVFTWYAGAGIPFGSDFPIHPAQLTIANLLATYAEQFVICHELAHHVMGHVTGGTEKNILIANVPVQTSNWNWEQEFEADEGGLRFLLWKGDVLGGNDTVMRYTGADFFLQVMSLYEELTNFPGSETHPPSVERLNRLRRFAASLCHDEDSKAALFQRAHVVEQMLQVVRQTLFAPTQEQSRHLEEKSQRLVQRLENLLDKYTGGMTPDYMSFYVNAFQLLEEGPTDILANTISTLMETYRQHLETLTNRESTHDDWITFQKLKLLLGFVEKLPAEVQAIIFR